MKKRSAMTIAGGLVVAMLAGAVALSLGFASGPTQGASVVRQEPRVRTIERTITIHKKAKPKPAVVQTIAAPAAPAAPAQAAQAAPARASDASTSDDDATGTSGDDGSDDQFEGEDHEDDGGSEDD